MLCLADAALDSPCGPPAPSATIQGLMCRRYKPFLVAEADAEPGDAGNEAAERLLQEYLAGSNDRKQPIDGTTPLFRDSACKVFCMLPGNQVRHARLLLTAMARCHHLFPLIALEFIDLPPLETGAGQQ